MGLYIYGAVLFISTGLYNFSDTYIGELWISFTPYWAVIFLCMSVLSFIQIIRLIFTQKRYLAYVFWVIYLLVSGMYTYMYALPVLRFYSGWDGCPETICIDDKGNDTGSTLRILYANVDKHNVRYADVIELIKEKNPDVLMFVEFTQEHHAHLRKFLSSNYLYINHVTWSQKFIGSTVFSKYPIINMVDTAPQQGAWRYGYFAIEHQDTLYTVYLVHTSSPRSYAFFANRNQQLNKVTDEIASHRQLNSQISSTGPLLLLGDFNVTPWSLYYDDFIDSLSGSITYNITRVLPIFFSWSLGGYRMVSAHIDHVFVNEHVDVVQLRSLYVPGSDHRGYLLEIK